MSTDTTENTSQGQGATRSTSQRLLTLLKWLAVGASVVLGCALLWAFVFLPGLVDRSSNRVHRAPPYAVSKADRSLHMALPFVSDLHGDSLLWKRDLLKRNAGRGHIDVPRLIEANVALQVFSIVSQAPVGQNVDRTDGDAFDQITLLSFVQLWPVGTWPSRLQRALYQARKLHGFAARSQGQLSILKSRRDLTAYLAARRRDRKRTAGLLAIEGAHVLEGNVKNVEVLFKAGFRMMAATHFFDNRLGGSAHGIHKGGLTPLGKQVLKKMDQLGMIVDIAHISQKAIDDTLALTKRPVVVSHTGVRGTCPNQRNLTDKHIKAIAKGGGVIGIGMWKKAVCGNDAAATAKAMRYVADLVGVDHVGLGSDFDGSIKAHFDVTGLPLLIPAMKAVGFTPKDIAKIMGGNVLRLLQQTLPQ